MSGIAQCLNGPVQAGDMVQVALPMPCCGSRKNIGSVFRVLDIDASVATCSACGASYPSVDAIFVIDDEGDWGEPVSRLIRIDPPALPESIDTEREVTA